VAHRLTIAGGSRSVAFTPRALDEVHRLSGGIPRLINLICDRALLAGYAVHSRRISPDMVVHAAQSLDMQAPLMPRLTWRDRPASLLAATAVLMLSAAGAVGSTAYLYERFAMGTTLQASSQAMSLDQVLPPAGAPGRQLPDGTAATILAGTFSLRDPVSPVAARALTEWLEASGYQVYYAVVELGARGQWQRVLAGAYTDPGVARVDAARLNEAASGLDARAVTAGFATGTEP
jgi:hypothetical protein